MTKAFASEAMGLSYAVETSETVVLRNVVELTSTATVKQSTSDSVLVAGVANESSYRGRVEYASGTPSLRADDTVYEGEIVAVQAEGEAWVVATSSALPPGTRVKSAGSGQVEEIDYAGGDTAEMMIGYTTNVKDASNNVKIKLL